MSDRHQDPPGGDRRGDDGSIHDLAALYALDALDPTERRRFEAHYPTCPSCREEVEGFQRTATMLAESASVEPPPELKGEIMDRIRSTRQLPPEATEPAETTEISGTVEGGSEPTETPAPVVRIGPDGGTDRDLPRDRRAARPGRRPTWPLAAAAAVLVAAAIGIGGWLVAGSSPSAGQQFATLLDRSDVVVTELDGDDGPGRITVAWSADRDEVGVRASGLADPDDGDAYALWLLPQDGAPVPAGLFVPSDGEVVTVGPVDDVDSAGWGITIEPESGSDQPTSAILFSGATS